MEKLPKIGIPVIVILIFTIILVAKSAITIDAGEAGVLYKLLIKGL